jgi:tetratricopeptide (TPR) repeat protein
MKEKWRPIGHGVLLVVLTMAAYWPALRGGFIWDDDAHLTANPCIVGSLGFKAIWTSTSAVYYPLVLTSFWIQHAIWGLNPLFFHLVNVLMHAMSAVLLWRVLLRLEVPGAWLGAALWALHPVQVESVAWITELKNTQSCVFYLLAILFFLRWRAAVRREQKESILDYALVILFAALATLSKVSTVMLPVVLGLCWWWKERSWRWRNTLWLLPFLIVSAAASAWTVWEQKFHAGAHGGEWAQTGLERFAIAGKAIWFYLGKLLWPHPLIFIYPRWKLDVPQAISLLPPAAVIFLWIIFWLGRDERRLRPVFFAFTYFLISLFPVMGFFNVYFFRYSFVGDHFQYLASMGLIALLSAGLSQLPKPMQTLPVVLLSVLLVMTWQQTKIYRDQETLWRDTLAKNPVAAMAHTNLGIVLTGQGKLPEAIQHYERALQLRPDDAEAYVNLGVAEGLQGKLPEAIQYYERALQLRPDHADAYNNLGAALAAQGKLPEAVQHYKRALQLRPDDAGTHYNLGIALARQRKFSEAIQQYERALQLKSDDANTYVALGVALAGEKKLPEAIQQYERALQLKPDDAEAHNNLGGVLADQHKFSEAIQHYEQALQLRPDDAKIYFNLGNTLADEGKLPEAIQQYERALQLKGDYVEALNNLGYVLATSQNPLLRNGVKAVALSEQANQLTGTENPVILGTLAAAYAEAGRYSEAVETVSRAIERARVEGNSALVTALESQLEAYRAMP